MSFWITEANVDIFEINVVGYEGVGFLTQSVHS